MLNSISESQPNKSSDRIGDDSLDIAGEPFVRYGFPPDRSPRQEPNLRHISETIPDGATTASPIYFLTDAQIERQEGLENPYAVSQTNIARKLQDECEQEGRVLNPLYVESDDESATLYEQREAIKRFAEEYLNVEPFIGTAWYSGNRSIHLHLPRYVRSKAELGLLKQKAEEFNEESAVTIDSAIYSRKRQFRLPSTEHPSTSRPKCKVPIAGPEQELRREMAQAVAEGAPEGERRNQLYIARDSSISSFEPLESALSQNTPHIKDIATPLVEQKQEPENEASLERWKQYNRHPFSPYANAAGGERSVTIARVKGSPFCREVDGDRRTLVPAYIYGAVGAAGEFDVARENCPIKLSGRDYSKWEYEKGDVVALISGRSRESRIFQIERNEFTIEEQVSIVVGGLVEDIDYMASSGDLNGRAEALSILEDLGYEVGSAGSCADSQRYCYRTNQSSGEGSDAYSLQKKAEAFGVQALSHQERLTVANRLLSVRGVEGTWKWLKERFGQDFDPELTHSQLTSVTKRYDDLPNLPLLSEMERDW